MKASASIEYTVGQPMPGTKWIVRGELGQGGMGLVLDVMKAGLIPGAMKVLLPPFAGVPEFAGKFLDEVKVTALCRLLIASAAGSLGNLIPARP
jgi:hypothetical protein